MFTWYCLLYFVFSYFVNLCFLLMRFLLCVLHVFGVYFREELYRQFYVHRMRMGDPTAMRAPEEVFRSEEEAGKVRDDHRGGNDSGVVVMWVSVSIPGR